MSKATRKILKKFDGMIIDYEEGKDWAELSVDKNFIVSVYSPYKEQQRAETLKYLRQLNAIISDMEKMMESLPLREVKKLKPFELSEFEE